MKNVFLILNIFLTINLFGFGLGDSDMETPYGSLLDNYSGDHITIQLPNNVIITDVVAFYFYEGHIVGRSTYNNYENKIYEEEYFIANEVTSEVESFSVKEKWKQELELKKLTPKLWTRWHNHIPDEDILFFLLIIYSPIALLLLVFLNKLKIKGIVMKSLIFLIIVFLIVFVLNKFHQSI